MLPIDVAAKAVASEVVYIPLVTVPALPVTEPVIAFVQVISVAQSFANLEPVKPIVWGVVWSVNTAPFKDVK